MGTTRPGYTADTGHDIGHDTGHDTGHADTDDTGDTCTAREASCRCTLPAHLDGPHVCDCGGSWEWTETGRFIVHAWPG